MAGGLFGPLDQTHGIVAKILAQPSIFKLFRMIETIKIKVIPVYARNNVNFNQRIGRTLHRPLVPQGAKQRARQRRLARAKLAVEPDDRARFEQGRQFPPERRSRFFVRQIERERMRGRHRQGMNGARIRAMQGKHSATDANTDAATRGGMDFAALARDIKIWGRELGFAEIGISGADVSAATPRLLRWLELGRHGEMDYMAKHAALRAEPQALVPDTLSVVSVRLPYWPEAADGERVLASPELGYVSRYALGRDYHKTIRNRLQKLADRIRAAVDAAALTDAFAYRVFSDSAPVMEVEFARQSGIAWRGKHTLSLTRSGSWHFLGDIYTTLPLPPDEAISEHCGECTRCIDVCPTAAIVAPYEVDARRCISYLTIELHGAIPEAFRPLIGNRIYGCDDCQLHCPWNRFAQVGDPDFAVRNGLDRAALSELFAWSADEFDARLAGSPIRRIGHERWLRNIAVALGNQLRIATDHGPNSAPSSPPVSGGAADPAADSIRAALRSRRDHPSALVREHVEWALAQDADRPRQIEPRA